MLKKEKRILCLFDFNSRTGYATVSENLVRELKDIYGSNLKLHIVAINYFGDPFYYMQEKYGQDVLVMAAKRLNELAVEAYNANAPIPDRELVGTPQEVLNESSGKATANASQKQVLSDNERKVLEELQEQNNQDFNVWLPMKGLTKDQQRERTLLIKDDFAKLGFCFALTHPPADYYYDGLFVINDPAIICPLAALLELIKRDFIKANKKSFKSICYFPMDCKPFPSLIPNIEKYDNLVTYTNFAKDEIIKIKPELRSKLKVIPHGNNPADFYPLPEAERLAFRKEYFGDNADKFIINWTNRNQPRKDLPTSIFAFLEAKKNWDKALPEPFLYLHTNPIDHMGIKLKVLFEQLPELVEGKDYMLLPDKYLHSGAPKEDLNKIYNACDVHVTTALGEGWGLCILSDVKVLTSAGAINIQDIQKEDIVLSNDGLYNKVLDTTKRSVDSYYKVKPRFSEEIGVTAEHPFYALRNGVAEWVKVGDLKQGDFIGIRKPIGNKPIERNIDLIDFVDNNKYCFDDEFIWHKNGFSPKGRKMSHTFIQKKYEKTKKVVENARKYLDGVTKKISNTSLALALELERDGYEPSSPIKIKRHIIISDDLLQVFGWYLAEGSITGCRVEFSTNLDCREEMNWCNEVFNNVFGIYGIVRRDGVKKCQLRVSNSIIADFFCMFGRGAYNKHVPATFAGCEKSLMPLVYGYLCGDGHLNPESNTLRFNTVSPSLAYQIRNILISNCIFCNIKKHKPPSVTEGRKFKGNYDLYDCNVLRHYLHAYEKAIHKDIPFSRKHKRKRKISDYLTETDTHFFVPVQSIELTNEPQKVYDLCVDNAHSFTANGIICHNTVTEAMATKLPLICPNNTSMMEMSGYGNRAFLLETQIPFCNNDSIIREQCDYVEAAEKLLLVAQMKQRNDPELLKKVEAAYKYTRTLEWKNVAQMWKVQFDKILM